MLVYKSLESSTTTTGMCNKLENYSAANNISMEDKHLVRQIVPLLLWARKIGT